ncbi:FeoB small GTPase domain-containing protein [Pannus brasiliensis]|uniref:FeoB small GTPase domain-containing protein n=1 Tax=Pannus brasiliensis TaxID=1579216 RepID=UPI003BEF4174
MTCHAGAGTTGKSNALKRVGPIGMPNTGKSTFFHRITGATAFMGNRPGITVDLLQANVQIDGETIEFVDLPGIYDLNGFSDDEKVVRRFFASFEVDPVVMIVNAVFPNGNGAIGLFSLSREIDRTVVFPEKASTIRIKNLFPAKIVFKR